jgi:hypothetical protein
MFYEKCPDIRPDPQIIAAEITDHIDDSGPPKTREREFVFNTKERSVRITTAAGNQVNWTMTYKLDNEGLLVRQTGKRLLNEDTVYTYKLDQRGNWIEREEHPQEQGKDSPRISNAARSVTFRVITYYDEK